MQQSPLIKKKLDCSAISIWDTWRPITLAIFSFCIVYPTLTPGSESIEATKNFMVPAGEGAPNTSDSSHPSVSLAQAQTSGQELKAIIGAKKNPPSVAEFRSTIEWLRANWSPEMARNLKLLESKKSDTRANIMEHEVAAFSLGILYKKLGKSELADENFKEAIRLGELFQDYSLYYVGMLAKEKGDSETAQISLRGVLAASPNQKLRNTIEFETALANLASKRYNEARSILLRLAKKERGSQLYPTIVWTIASSPFRHREVCSAAKAIYQRYFQLTQTKEWTAAAPPTRIGSNRLNCTWTLDDRRTRIRNLQLAGLHEKAREESDELIKQLRTKRETLAADRVQASYWIQEGETQKAFDILIPYSSQALGNQELLIHLGQVAARNLDSVKAISFLLSASRIKPTRLVSIQALFQSAFLSYQNANYDLAYKLFHQVTLLKSRGEISRDAKWHMAWIEYLKGDYPRSSASFAKLQGERAQYWRAMALQKSGLGDEARKAFSRLTRLGDASFYSLAALEQTKTIGKSEPQDVISSVDSDSSPPEVETSDAPLATPKSADFQTDEDSSTFKEENFEDSWGEQFFQLRILRARLLSLIDEKDWARWDLFQVEQRPTKREIKRNLISEYERLENFHRSAYLSSVQFGAERRKLGFSAARELWESAFPRAYALEVEKASKEYKIPSFLIWALMKQESQFRKDVISPAGARGLMQVMPFTARRIASLKAEPAPEPDSLLEPETSIRLGAIYIQRLMKFFDGNVALVAAAYNAGPHRVKSWISAFGGLTMDEFIEHIPYGETRTYVKKVMSNLDIYSKLYRHNDFDNKFLTEPLSIRFVGPKPTKENWDEI